MTRRPLFNRSFHAQNQLPPRDQTVQVVTDPGTRPRSVSIQSLAARIFLITITARPQNAAHDNQREKFKIQRTQE